MSAKWTLQGKLALVTGASRGLGAEIARHLHSAGAILILAARDEQALKAQQANLPESQICPVDLSDPQQVERLVAFCISQKQPVEIVVNNAAIQGPIGPFETADFSAWHHVFQINFFAAARICQGLIGPMRQLGRGKIINLSGGGAASPRPDLTAYGVSKCALVRLSETLAQELTGTGIDVNCVAPGAMNTQMLIDLIAAGPKGATREYEKALKQQQSGGAPPAKAAELVAFLACGASDGITGRLISAVWDDWITLPLNRDKLAETDIYTLRRIVPEDRKKW
jgi:NAD(P)-dependent dehydrogenase (short-subunit alcohol dehydrogenase family)